MAGTNPVVSGRVVYPVHMKNPSGIFARTETLLTPEKLKMRYLINIPLGGLGDEEVLKDRINLAMNEVEILLKTSLSPEKRVNKLPYDSRLYRSFINLMVQSKPIVGVYSIKVTSSNGDNVYNVPPEWIESANFHKGQINIIPLLSTLGVAGAATANEMVHGGLVFLATLGQYSWLPAFWEIEYTSGLSTHEGCFPIVVNQIIGITAAMDILSNLDSTNTSTSVSISHDGESQSHSSPGPRKYEKRILDLQAKRDELMRHFKSAMGNSYFVGNI